MVWNAIMENEEVQALNTTNMNDLIDTLVEIRVMHQPDKNFDKLKARNATILRREIKSVEFEYLNMWKKFKEDKNYTEAFLGINAHLSFLYFKWDEIEMELNKYVHPIVLRQTKLRFKRIRLEQKYENSNEILKERKKIQDFKNNLFNKRSHEEINLLLPESKSASRAEAEIARKEFLRSWKKYEKKSNLEGEFLENSNEYAKLLSKVKTLETKIRNWEKTKPYNQMLRENYIRYSILEDCLLNEVGK